MDAVVVAALITGTVFIVSVVTSSVVGKFFDYRKVGKSILPKKREKAPDPTSAIQNLFLIESIMNEMRRDMALKKARKGNLLAFLSMIFKDVMKKQCRQVLFGRIYIQL